MGLRRQPTRTPVPQRTTAPKNFNRSMSTITTKVPEAELLKRAHQKDEAGIPLSPEEMDILKKEFDESMEPSIFTGEEGNIMSRRPEIMDYPDNTNSLSNKLKGRMRP
jgi:hypothetical protein